MKLKAFGLLVFSAAAALALVAGSFADEGEDDHEQARELYEQGRIHSLLEVLKGIEGRIEGEVVGVDLLQLGDRWIYRFQVINRDGQRSFVDIDAGSDVVFNENENDD